MSVREEEGPVAAVTYHNAATRLTIEVSTVFAAKLPSRLSGMKLLEVSHQSGYEEEQDDDPGSEQNDNSNPGVREGKIEEGSIKETSRSFSRT